MVDRCFRRTEDEIESGSPSRAEGISLEKERRLLRCCHRLIDTVATRRHAFPSYLSATAHYLVRRFYSQRSFVANDSFCIAAAALGLAGKFENRPKGLDYVIAAMFEARYVKDPKALERFKNTPRYRAEVKESVLHAEELLLETVGHAFHIDHPYCHLFDLISLTKLETSDKRVKLLVKRFWQMVNDSCKTALWLQYSARKIAVAVFILSCRYSVLHIDVHPLLRYYHDQSTSPSDDCRHEIKHIWSQLTAEYDPKCPIHEHANMTVT